MATRGYITIVQDDDGSEALYASDTKITDPEHIPSTTKLWKLFAGGFGYSRDGGITYDMAMTMDGAIVADRITAGTLNGEILRAGSVSATAISQKFKSSIANDINTVRQEFIVAEGELRSSIEAKIDGTSFNSLLEQNYEHILTAFNDNSSVIEMSVSGIDIYSNGRTDNNRLIRFNGNGMTIWRTGVNIGKIGTNSWTGYPDYRGLVFDLEYAGSYMTWARKINSSDTEYTVVLTYARQGAGFQNEGLYFGCNAYINGNEINSPNLTNVSTNGHATFTGQRTFVTGVNLDSDGKVTSVDTTTCNIQNGMIVSFT